MHSEPPGGDGVKRPAITQRSPERSIPDTSAATPSQTTPGDTNEVARAHSFAARDEQPFRRAHWLELFTIGMGVFTGGYDDESIGLMLLLVAIASMWPRLPTCRAAYPLARP